MEQDWSKFFNQEDIETETDPETEIETKDINNSLDNINEEENHETDMNIEETVVHAETFENTDETINPNDDRVCLNPREFKSFCERLTGLNATNETKAVMNYQAYDVDPEDIITDPQSNITYDIHNAIPEFSFDELNPDLMVLSIRFKSFDDPELRMLWARIQKWRTRMSTPLEGNKIPIFLLHFLERDSLGTMDNMESYTILECNILNPLLCYITREVPTNEAIDIINEKDEHIGGNVIKCLCSTELTTFTLRNDIDTASIKAEVLREEEDERYINESPLYANEDDTL